jgi:hypothetical protein
MPVEPLTPAPVDRRPPQFSLRALFWLMAVVSALCAAMTAMGMVWSLMLLFFVALVVAHVVGNAIGTRLRDDATRQIEQSSWRGPALPHPALPRMVAPPLHERRPLGQSLFVFVIAGAVGGALLGRFAFTYGHAHPLPASDAVLAIASCAVVGAIAGFMASSFFKVAVWPAVKYFFRK